MDFCVQTHLPVARAHQILRPPAVLAFLLWAGLQAPAALAVDCGPVTDGATLAAEIAEVNAGNCDTIHITGDISLSSQNLPIIDRAGATITIQGDGAKHTVDGTGTSRLFAVVSGDVTLRNLVIEDGLAKGGDGGSNAHGGGGAGGALGAGGGLFIGASGTVTLEDVDFAGNTAQGGAGGDSGAGGVGSGGGGGGLNGGAGGSGSGAIKGGSGGGGAFGGDGGGNAANRGGSGGGGGGNNADDGADGTSNSGASGGVGDSGAGGTGGQGDDSDPGADGTGMGGGGGGGSANNYTAVGNGGDGGALGGGGGGGGEAHFVTGMNGTGDGGSGGDGGFGGGGGGGGSSYQSSAGTWTGGAGGLGGFGAGGGGGGAARGGGAPTMVAGAGSAGGVLGGDGGDGGVGNVAGGGGGGGAGLGGAIFVQNGGQLNIGQSVTFGTNTVAGGAGGTGTTAGTAGGSAGANIYALDGAAGLGSNATVGFSPGAGQTIELDDSALGLLQAGYSGQLRKTGAGEVELTSSGGLTTSGWSVVAGILRGTTDNLIGALANDGQLVLDQSFDGTLAGDLTGSGSLVKDDAGNVTLTGENDAYTGAVEIEAGTLTVNGSGLGDTSAVTVGGSGQLSVGASGETIGSLAGSGDVSLSGTLDTGGNDTTTVFSGDISGTGSLTKSGTGNLFLSGTNSYTGGTTINAGTLQGTTLGLVGDIVNNSALVFYQPFDGAHTGDISGSGSLTKSGNGTLTLGGTNSYSGGTTITAGRLVGTTSSLTGDIINNSAMEFDQATNGTYAGDISGTGSLTKSGSGTVTLTGTNNYSGGTTIDAGTLIGTTSSLIGAIVNNSALEFAQSFNGTYGGTITGSGNLTKSGTGTVTFSGNNDAHTGSVQISDGTLSVDGSGIGDTSAVTVGGSGQLSVGASGETIGSLAGSGDVSLSGTLDTGGNDTTTAYAGDISGSGGLTKSGSGTLTLSGNNDAHTGAVQIDDGTLAVDGSGIGDGSSVTVSLGGQLSVGASGETIGSLAGAGDVTLNGTLDAGGNDTTTVFSGDISGSGGLTKSGNGTLTLSGNNDAHTGAVQIDAGTLAIDGSGIGDGSSVTVSLGGQLSVGASGETIGSLAGAGGVTLNGTLDTGGNNATTVFSGDISGSGSLTKSGNGTLTLSGTNSYSGGTTIDAGTLIGTTSSLIGAIANNGALEFAQSFNGTHAGDITGSGSLTKSGTGTVTLMGTNSYSGGTTIDAGTLRGTTLSLTGDVINNATIEFVQSVDGTYTGNITGTGGLAKTGAGTLYLTGTNSYTGPTTVTAGTLSVNGAVLSSVNVSSGATLMGSGGVGRVTAQGIVAPGNSIGTMTVTGDLTLAPGSVLEVEFDDAGNADRLTVTGTVTLDGTLRLLPTVGSYVTNTQYLIIDAAAVGSSFATSEIIDETRLGGLQATVTITADQVLLELASASFGGGSGGGSGPVADYLDELRPDATGDLADVIAELEVLPIEQIDEALQSLAPQTVDAIPIVQAAYGRVLTDVMERRLQGLRSGTFGTPFSAGLKLAPTPLPADNYSTGSLAAALTTASFEEGLLALVDTAEQSGSILEVGDVHERLWLQLIGEFGRRKDEAEFLGYGYQLYGAITGFEHRLSPDWQVGANVALGHSEVEFDHDRGGNEGMSYAGGAYLGWTPQPGVAIDLLGWAGVTKVDSQRNVAFGGMERQAEGKTDVRSLGVDLRGELSGGWDAWQFDAFAGASYTSNWQDAYCETGAGSVNLCVEAMHTSEVAGELGGGISYDIELGSGALTIDVQAAVTARQPLDDRAIRSGFAGQAGGFTIPGDDEGEFGLAPKVGLIYRVDNQLSLSAHYSGHFGQNTTAHSVQAGLSFRF